ncbi:MAG TPA: DUF4174 domain-containing protein [Alphaproteobacteria bacterium]|nr:DUF4174 domain-containing protein [Micavibrio sp.]HQX26595.1 DUF4174 domain-containing protein [Alphaproteobacteria bacterium]
MKKKSSFAVLAFFLLFSGVIHPAYAAEAQADIDAPFDRLVGKAWALVLTGPELDPLYIQQIEMLTPAAPQLIKHEIVTIHFDDRSLNVLPELSVSDYRLPVLRENKDTNLLEELLYTDDDVFSVVLVGKDGVAKYVWPTPVSPREIFDMMANPKPLIPLVPKAPQPAQ